MEKSGIQQAVDAIGDQPTLAEKINVSKQAVAKWVSLGYVPVGRARQIELVSGVDRRKLVDPVIRDLFE